MLVPEAKEVTDDATSSYPVSNTELRKFLEEFDYKFDLSRVDDELWPLKIFAVDEVREGLLRLMQE